MAQHEAANGGCSMTTIYLELPSDHAFTAWLSTLIPSQVLKDRERLSTLLERRQVRYFQSNSKEF